MSIDLKKNIINNQYILSASKELLADEETPVSAFYKICHKKPYSFLLESVEGGEKIGRYSIIGTDPIFVFTNKNNKTYLENKTENTTQELDNNPFTALKDLLSQLKIDNKEIENFIGFVGYFGYENIRWIEPKLKIDNYKELPDACLILPGKLIVFDHILHKVNLIANVSSGNPENKLNSLLEDFQKPVLSKPLTLNYNQTNNTKYKSNYSKEKFIDLVNKAKKHIVEGNIFQVVLSQKLTLEKNYEGFSLYRALRSINPSPYLFYLNFNDFELAGSSPEVMVKCEKLDKERLASLRPIAGTYERGKNNEEDLKNIKDLLNDPKEKAEHLMLVDLARNDIGKVCKTNTVNVTELMTIEKYSHVLHMVSQVEGLLKDDKTAVDLLQACFPAGTLSGAPKVRAMEIINELENSTRGPYGGCAGFIGLNDTINTCMTIRTFVIFKDKIEIQAGAGIVADSNPENEFQETLRKGAALLKAVSLLEN